MFGKAEFIAEKHMPGNRAIRLARNAEGGYAITAARPALPTDEPSATSFLENETFYQSLCLSAEAFNALFDCANAIERQMLERLAAERDSNSNSNKKTE